MPLKVAIMKYFVCSDVHGYYNALMEALNKNNFDINNKDHILIVLGDLFDRGPDNRKVYEFVKSLSDRFVYVRGNHEDLLMECISEIVSGNYISSHHFHNKTVDTIAEFCGLNPIEFYNRIRFETTNQKVYEVMKPIMNWINEKSVNYYQLDNNIFVHGWIPNKYMETWSEANWYNARWKNGMEEWKNGLVIPDKTIWCGHWHCSWGWSYIRQKYKEFPQKNRKNWEKSFQPFVDDGIVATDSCVAYSGFLNCVVYDEENKSVIL